MPEEPPFEIAFPSFAGESQKVEVVRVFDELLCEVGLGRRQRRLEVGLGFSLATVEAAFDVDDEHIAAPAVFDRLLNIPEAFFGGFEEVQESDVMAPGNLCNSLLHNCFVRPSLG